MTATLTAFPALAAFRRWLASTGTLDAFRRAPAGPLVKEVAVSGYEGMDGCELCGAVAWAPIGQRCLCEGCRSKAPDYVERDRQAMRDHVARVQADPAWVERLILDCTGHAGRAAGLETRLSAAEARVRELEAQNEPRFLHQQWRTACAAANAAEAKLARLRERLQRNHCHTSDQLLKLLEEP